MIIFLIIKNVTLFVAACLIYSTASAQLSPNVDSRPQAKYRMDAVDAGIILRYGDGKDSCDVFGAREAIVNKENGIYYLFYDGAGKDGWLACLAESRDLKTWTKKGAI